MKNLIGRLAEDFHCKEKFNEKKNSCTPINPKKYSCYGLKKVHTRNLITKKNSCDLKIPHLPPLTFLMVRPLHAGVRRISYIAINKYAEEMSVK